MLLQKRNDRLIRGRAWRAASLIRGELSALKFSNTPSPSLATYVLTKKQQRSQPFRVASSFMLMDRSAIVLKVQRHARRSDSASRGPAKPDILGAHQIKLDKTTQGQWWLFRLKTHTITRCGLLEKDKCPTIWSHCVKGTKG